MHRSLLARLFAVSLVASASIAFVGCGPSAEDEKLMAEKMDLEVKQAKIWSDHKNDCKKMHGEFVAFRKEHGGRLKAIDDWWGKLGDGAKDKLIEKHRKEWDSINLPMVEIVVKCPDEWKDGMKTY